MVWITALDGYIFIYLGLVSRSGLSTVPDFSFHHVRLSQKQEIWLASHFYPFLAISHHSFYPDHGKQLEIPHPQPQPSPSTRFYGQLLLQTLRKSFSLFDGYIHRVYLCII